MCPYGRLVLISALHEKGIGNAKTFFVPFFVALKEIFFANAKSDIFLAENDITRFCLAVIFYSPDSLRSKYHSAQAEYHRIAISLTVDE